MRIEELLGGEDGNIDSPNGVVLGHSCIAKETSNWDRVALRGDMGEEHNPREPCRRDMHREAGLLEA